MKKAEVLKRLKGLNDVQSRSVACALVGHSRVQTACFGYFNCARCGDAVGDSLGSIYPGASLAVVVDHHCKTCRANAQTLTWRDTLQLPSEAAEYLKKLKEPS